MPTVTSAALMPLLALEDCLGADQAAAGATSPPPAATANTHIHLPPNFSAFETVARALDLAAEQGVRVLGASNYYDYTVYESFAAGARARSIFPLFGAEIIAMDDILRLSGVKVNDPGNPGKIYFCGKGIVRFDPADQPPAAQYLLEQIRRRDAHRIDEMARRLADYCAAHGVESPLDAADIHARVVARHACPPATVTLQERHLAQAYQELLFETTPRDRITDRLRALLGAPVEPSDDPAAVQNALRAHLLKSGKPAFVEEDYVTLEEARRLVLELGGIPCYPVLADGTEPITEFESDPETLIAHLRQLRVHCVEFIPVRNRPEVLLRYVRALRAAGFVATAGTEHNTLEPLPVAPTCRDGAPLPAEARAIFWEGACVVAAHQFHAARGEDGFVNARDEPNRRFENDEQRIAAFAGTGARLIEAFCRRA
ncbi:MAG TPA: hypothetical protein PLS90_03715 [Candidatus Sumerlaeota bacterium]|nr:hypothetical protein [Candidatus Sumerlaeota bacterium]